MTMTPENISFDLTPQHVRAARALLAWSQQELAKAAGVATSTVADFERGKRTPVVQNAQAMRQALEQAEIRFLPTGAVIGPSVPGMLAAQPEGALPVRWVSAQDLMDWADRIDGAFSLPTLINHLIYATHGGATPRRFPSDESVRFPGWDGRTSVTEGSRYVPQGEACWEIGSQRSKVEQKAAEDYQKRSLNPGSVDPARATFVFVTPRHWPQKDAWAQDRQAEGVWREVRVYDADDLVHWMEQAPAVGLWLATRLGKRPEGILELDHLWEEWSRATLRPLTAELVLSDRDEDAAQVLRWLRGEPAVLSLQGTTAYEVVAFFYATLDSLPHDAAATYRARCLVATTAISARTLTHAPAPLIVLLTQPESGLAHVLVQRGHYVLQAYDERPVTSGSVRALARPSREGIACALVHAGVAEPRAEALARDSARNLAVLRRLMPSAPGRLPSWAREAPPRALLAALLVGGWDENEEADRACLAQVADLPYEAVTAALASYVGDFDSPLQKIGSTWRIASPRDAWGLLARYLSNSDITRFEAVAQAVLGAADPRFDMPSRDLGMAAMRGVRAPYSGLLRHGIAQVLISLALWGGEIRTVAHAAQRADTIVRTLLRHADAQRWWSLSGDFQLLAEASPPAFLNAIEDSLDQTDPPIRALFRSDGEGAFITEYLSNLLWALESLAWSPDWMPRVTHVLARLDAIDPSGRYTNRPGNSLREIHILWNPQTHAPLALRLKALDLIRRRESNAAWKLMLGILPSGHDISTPSPMPRWRDFSVDQTEEVTYGLVAHGAAAITERLLLDAGENANQWSILLGRFAHLAPDTEAGLVALEAVEPKITDRTDRTLLWKSLRRELHRHREFPNAQWALPAPVLNRLEVIYHRFGPLDALERTAWLFSPPIHLHRPSSDGWEAQMREIEAAQRKAAQALLSENGTRAILALARQINAAGYLGKALYDSGLAEADLDALLEITLRSDNAGELDLAHGLIASSFNDLKASWALGLIAQVRSQAWGDTALLTLFHALPMTRWVWDEVAKAGPSIEQAYWRRAPVLWMNDADDTVFAIHKLVAAGRARHALALAGHGGQITLPSDVLVEVLRQAVRQPYEGQGDHNEATMFQHYVAKALQVLDERSDVTMDTLLELEWAYLPLLDYSERPVKVLLRALANQPALFVQMLCAIFKPSEDSGIQEPEPQDPEHAQALAMHAYELLRLWDRLPGTREDGTIDAKELESWVKEARQLAQVAGRQEIADDQIGQMLSASPMGADGQWPTEAVREVIDLFHSQSMLEGFRIGKYNRRGVTVRMPHDGGAVERQEAAKYRGWAKAMECEYPYTAKALHLLADGYEREARSEDEDTQRLDWM